MTPLSTLLLAALIQTSDPTQEDALLALRSFALVGSSDLAIPDSMDAASESATVSRPTILFLFPNRHDAARFDPIELMTPTGISSFSHFVRCHRTNKERSVAPRLIEIVLAAVEHFGVDSVEIISGYRARPYGAPHSKHFLGQALDIRLTGIPSARLSTWIWATFHNVGVGYYTRQNFVHVDTRDADIRWVEESRHGESGLARYFTRTGRKPVASTDRAPSLHASIAARPAI
jgi:uncharacterized protein YcbK (DUF882 family)